MEQETVKQLPKYCPLSGDGARMTRIGFALVCLEEQERRIVGGRFIRADFVSVCATCAIGSIVNAGCLNFPSPPRIEFFEIKDFAQKEKKPMEKQQKEKPAGLSLPETACLSLLPVLDLGKLANVPLAGITLTSLRQYWFSQPLSPAKKKGKCPNCEQTKCIYAYGLCGTCAVPGTKLYGAKLLEKLAEQRMKHIDQKDAAGMKSPCPSPSAPKKEESPILPVEKSAQEENMNKKETNEKQEQVKHVAEVPAVSSGQTAFAIMPGYEPLASVLQEAMNQAQHGKGIERHANGEPFDRQKICEITRRVGLGYPLGQAIKKAEESVVLGGDRGRAELLGAINYLAAAVICSREIG